MDARLILPRGTILGENFRIERVIGSGGFGITYSAEDITLGTMVAVKEYYPGDFGDREPSMRIRPKSERHRETFDWGRASFVQEARTLARFRHPSIVRISRVFEAFSTAYMVMDFEQGQSLENWLRSLGRAPSQDELDRIVAPLLDALEMLHAASFLHRDIAPDNIIVRPDGTPVLLDFGAARRAVAEKSRALTGIVKAGYSPFEQYASDSRLQGPWSDIYALGATLYRAVVGNAPEEATLRVADDRMQPAAKAARGRYRQGFLQAIDSCLQPKHAARPQTVAQLRPALLDSPKALVATTRAIERPRDIGPTEAPQAGLAIRGRWIGLTVAMLLVVGVGYGVSEYAGWPAQPKTRPSASGDPPPRSQATTVGLPADRSFTAYRNIGLQGDVIDSDPHVSRDACTDRCRANTSCVAAEHDSEFSRCTLFSTVARSVVSSRYTTYGLDGYPISVPAR